jgi:cytoplasmic FMR1 interacting protein
MLLLFVLQQLEIVPLYGDMQVSPFSYIKNSSHYDPSKWPNCESSHVSQQSSILNNLEQIREEHTSFVSQLSRHSNQVI